MVATYLGYTLRDGKVTADEADYVLTTARNIGGGTAVKTALKDALKLQADVFEVGAKEKLNAFIKGTTGAR